MKVGELQRRPMSCFDFRIFSTFACLVFFGLVTRMMLDVKKE